MQYRYSHDQDAAKGGAKPLGRQRFPVQADARFPAALRAFFYFFTLKILPGFRG